MNAESQFCRESLKLKSGMSNPSEVHLNENQAKRFLKFIFGDDLDFYGEHLMDLADEQIEKLFEENPDFMSEYPISRDMMYLLKDKMFREYFGRLRIMREECRDEVKKNSNNNYFGVYCDWN